MSGPFAVGDVLSLLLSRASVNRPPPRFCVKSGEVTPWRLGIDMADWAETINQRGGRGCPFISVPGRLTGSGMTRCPDALVNSPVPVPDQPLPPWPSNGQR